MVCLSVTADGPVSFQMCFVYVLGIYVDLNSFSVTRVEVDTAQEDTQAQPPHCLGWHLIGSGRFHPSLLFEHVESLLSGGAVYPFFLSVGGYHSHPEKPLIQPESFLMTGL